MIWCCKHFQEGIKQIDDFIVFASNQSGGPPLYSTPAFKFCPWCGSKISTNQQSKSAKEIIMEYILVQDNDGHWYVIPEDKHNEFDEWLEIDSEDERSWNPPKYAKYINGSPSNVKFKEYIIK